MPSLVPIGVFLFRRLTTKEAVFLDDGCMWPSVRSATLSVVMFMKQLEMGLLAFFVLDGKLWPRSCELLP